MPSPYYAFMSLTFSLSSQRSKKKKKKTPDLRLLFPRNTSPCNIHSSVIHVIPIVNRLEPLRDARDEICNLIRKQSFWCVFEFLFLARYKSVRVKGVTGKVSAKFRGHCTDYRYVCETFRVCFNRLWLSQEWHSDYSASHVTFCCI